MPASVLPSSRRARGTTLIEMLVGLVLFCLVSLALMQMMSSGRKMEDVVGTHLALQADVRRAVMSFIRDLQEGMIVVRPEPGQTLPYALVKDKAERLVFYSLSPTTKEHLFDLQRDLAGPTGIERKTVLEGVARITFSCLSDSRLMLHVDLGEEKQRTSFHTQVRLRNRDSVDPF